MFLREHVQQPHFVDMAARMLAKTLMHRLPASPTAVLQSSTLLKSPIFRQAAISPNLIAGTGHGLRKQSAFRYFADSAVARAVDSSLSQTLQEELEYEREQNKQLAEDVEPPGDWMLTEEPGDSILTLTRKHNGEEILVEFSVNDQPAEDDALELEDEELVEDEEPQVDISVDFDASIIKGDKALTFELSSDGTYLEINHVGLGSSREEPGDSDYDGPVYTELDEKVQRLFVEYLDERGINAQLGEYLLAIADNKEQREYVKWLDDVKGFIEQKA